MIQAICLFSAPQIAIVAIIPSQSDLFIVGSLWNFEKGQISRFVFKISVSDSCVRLGRAFLLGRPNLMSTKIKTPKPSTSELTTGECPSHHETTSARTKSPLKIQWWGLIVVWSITLHFCGSWVSGCYSKGVGLEIEIDNDIVTK